MLFLTVLLCQLNETIIICKVLFTVPGIGGLVLNGSQWGCRQKPQSETSEQFTQIKQALGASFIYLFIFSSQKVHTVQLTSQKPRQMLECPNKLNNVLTLWEGIKEYIWPQVFFSAQLIGFTELSFTMTKSKCLGQKLFLCLVEHHHFK